MSESSEPNNPSRSVTEVRRSYESALDKYRTTDDPEFDLAHIQQAALEAIISDIRINHGERQNTAHYLQTFIDMEEKLKKVVDSTKKGQLLTQLEKDGAALEQLGLKNAVRHLTGK
jgi:hypothetical protein